MKDQIDTKGADEAYKPTASKSREEKQQMWEDLKSKFKSGDKLTGKIFYKAAYGVFLDVGLSFPALLRIVDMIELDYSRFVTDTTYKLGEEIELTLIFIGDTPDKMDVHERE